MKKYKLTLPIGELFKFLNLDYDNYDEIVQIERDISINAPSGYVPIRGLIKKRGTINAYTLENGIKLKCDPKHLVKQHSGNFRFIKDSDHVIINNKDVNIKNSVLSKKNCDVYDLSLDFPHEYVTNSGVVCHNTTAAKILSSAIDADVMYINASDENNIDTVRDKIKGFASSMGFSKWKIIICDEFDFFTVNAMAALRNLMETFSETTRFILTCNYIEKVIPAIRSRCQEFEIYPPNKKDVAKRLAVIITESKVEFDLKDLVHIINIAYPDIRKAINITQNSIINNKLVIDKTDKVRLSYMDDLLVELKSKNDIKTKFQNIRQILADSKVRDFTGLYRFLFDNLDEFASGHVAPVILIIADSQYKDNMIVDKEINIASMFVQMLNQLNS